MNRNVKERVTVSVDPELLGWADKLVVDGVYDSRSAAIEAALDALHGKRMNEQFMAALAAVTPEDVVEQVAFAELGIGDWAEQLEEWPW